MSSDDHKQLKLTREICLANAEAFLSVAERELDKGVDHIVLHLSLLALEEIGKSILVTVAHTARTAGSERESPSGAMEDHVKKLFWALWGGRLIRNVQFTKESIEEHRHLATNLHDRRLESLYTDPRHPLPVDQRVDSEEARRLTALARARLELEKITEIAEFEEGDVEEISWFFASLEDPERRRQIFSTASLTHLKDAKSGKDWIRWLHGIFRQNENEMRAYAEKELRRQAPDDEDSHHAKYKMRLRIQTPSHSIRGNAFAKWNDGIDGVKIHRSDRKDARGLAKGELLIDLILPKAVSPGYVWDHGFFMAKLVVLAFNIGTHGVFWWHAHKDVSRYYEEIADLEADPRGGVKLVVEPHKRLHVNFDEARLVLDEANVRNVYDVFLLFMREARKIQGFLEGYALGLTLFSKTDIHLRLEVNAFDEFYKALKAAMRAFGDWDGESDFRGAVAKQFERIGHMRELTKTLDLGCELEADVRRERQHPITLTEVLAMKLYCDFYVRLKAREYIENVIRHEGPSGSD